MSKPSIREEIEYLRADIENLEESLQEIFKSISNIQSRVDSHLASPSLHGGSYGRPK
jgi:prefoldin subunit 5